MPSGYPHSRAVRWRLFDQVCRGVPLWRAAQDMGVSTTAASIWWRNAGAMKLIGGQGGGVADPGDLSLPGGPGHRLSVGERVEIMRGLDAGLSDAAIAEQTRPRPHDDLTVKYGATATPMGIITP